MQSNLTELDTPRRRGRRFPSLLVLLGGLIPVGGALLLGWQVLARQAPQRHTQVNTSRSSNQSGKGTPPEVADYVRQHLAQGLHLSTAQFMAKLQAGEAIGSLAAQQGLSGDQWHILEVTTYQAAYDRLVSEGKMTRQDAGYRMSAIRSYTQTVLDYLATTDCLGSPPQAAAPPSQLRVLEFLPQPPGNALPIAL